MPIVRPRHPITETDEIARALEVARRAWPELADEPTALLRQLILAGERSIEDRLVRRRRAIHTTAGSLAGSFTHGYFGDLREDWPA
ncbi:MAG: hypothetical protein WCE30_12620 [Mycobacterium sp.]